MMRTMGNFRILIGRYICIVFGPIFLLIGFISTSLSLYQIQTRSWPTTSGNIVYSRIVRGKSSALDVKYRYAVQKETFTGSTIAYDFHSSDFFTSVDTNQERWPVGKEVTVAYDPSHSERSVLLTGFQWLAALQSFLIFLIGLQLSVSLVRGLRAQKGNMNERVLSFLMRRNR
jgi:hypothetical protein